MVNDSHPAPGELRDYLLGKLPADSSDIIGSHLDTCAECERTAESMDQECDELLAELLSPPPAADFAAEGALARVLALFRRLDLTQVQPAAPDRSAPGPPKQLREYEILEKLGEGGMGAVYRARHRRLDKFVALKILSLDRLKSERAVARFEREMRAIGQLDHPNLIRAFDAGEVDGTHFLVMEYVDGCDLSQLVRRCAPLSVADACELVRQAATGLDYAHQHGLVHRDIKPSNLMLAATGGVKVLDLGLALFQDQLVPDRDLTHSGQVMGTIDYMAPEQCSDSHTVDIRADLYGLGATLYKLLVGSAPFGGPKYDRTIKKLAALASRVPTPVRDRRPEVPVDLSSLVDRLLSKRPEDRVQSPAELANKLLPFTTGSDLRALWTTERSVAARSTRDIQDDCPSTHPGVMSQSSDTQFPSTGDLDAVDASQIESRGVSALPPAGISRYGRWRATAAVCGLIVVLIGAVYLVRGLGNRENRRMETAAGDNAESIENSSRPRAATLAPSEPEHHFGWAPGPDEGGLPGLVLRPALLASGDRWQLLSRYPLDDWLAKALSPDGKQLAIGTSDGAVRVFDVATERLVRVFLGHRSFIGCLAWSRDGNWLATGGADNTVRLWDMATGNAGRVLVGHHGARWIARIAWAPDGQKLATAAFWGDYTLRVWDLQNGDVRTSDFKDGVQQTVVWSPDSKTLATSRDAIVYLWPADLSGEPRQLIGHVGNVQCVSFSPDGNWLLTGSTDKTIRIWDTAAWTTEKVLTDPYSYVTTAAWWTDSRTVAVGQQDGYLRQLQFPAGTETWRSTQTQPIQQVVWSEDESRLLDVDGWNFVRVWHADGRPESVQSWDRFQKAQALSPDGQRLAFATQDDTVKIRNRSSEAVTEFAPFIGQVWRLDWSQDGDRILVSGAEPQARIWNIQDNTPGAKLAGLRSATKCTAWRPDGTQLATGSVDRSLRTWTTAGKPLESWDLPSVPIALDWQPGGPWLAVVCEQDAKVRLLNTASREAGPVLECTDTPVLDVKWSHDGTRLATCGANQEVRVWNAHGKQEAAMYRDRTIFSSLAWSPDDRSLVAIDDVAREMNIHRSARVWRVDSDIVTTIDQPNAVVRSFRWTGDGRQLIVACSDSSLRSLDVVTGERTSTVLQLERGESVAISNAGEILTANPAADDQLIYVTQKATGAFDLLTPAEFRKQEHPAVYDPTAGESARIAGGGDPTIQPQDWFGQPEHWKMTAGEIVGSIGTATIASKGTFLCSKRSYRDFELSCRVKVDGGDSGVMIRSRHEAADKSAIVGPQVDMAIGSWGDLVNVTGNGSPLWSSAPTSRVNEIVNPNEFNQVFIRCVGKHLLVRINGLTTIDQDFPMMPEAGIVGWELSPGAVAVTIRGLELRELSAADVDAGATPATK